MNKEHKGHLVDPTESICPYLGLIDDPKTTTMYPTSDHACYRTSPPTSIILHYQHSCCLDASHVACPGFTDGWKDGFPKRLRSQKPVRVKSFFPSWTLFLGLGAIVVILVVGAILQINGSNTEGKATIEGGLVRLTSTETSASSATPTAIITLTPTETVELTPTITSSPTVIPTQTAGPGLSTPFGPSDLTFTVHEVLPGETFSIIASLYNTDPMVIESINLFSPPERTSLWVGDRLVVCVGCDNANGLPKLQAIFLDSRASLAELAETYNTAMEELIRWNDLGEGDTIEFPRWIIVKAD